MKLSIVIPVYNAEEYVQRTLNSLERQTFRDFEVVVIDDGCTDHTIEVCESFLQESELNLRIFKNIRGGVSSARNYGVSKANGQYIAFLDSDDLLHPDCYRILIENIESSDIDVVACAFDTFSDEEPTQECSTENYNTVVYSGGSSAAESMVSADKNMSVRGYVWNKVYKRALLEKVKFDESLVICEDSVFSWEIVKNAKELQLIQLPLYHYRKRENSSTGTANFEKNITAVKAYSRMIKDVLKKEVNLREQYQLELFRQYICWILRTAESDGRDMEKLSDLKEYIDLIPSTLKVKNLSFGMKAKFVALKKSPWMYICTDKMWRIVSYMKNTIKTLV